MTAVLLCIANGRAINDQFPSWMMHAQIADGNAVDQVAPRTTSSKPWDSTAPPFYPPKAPGKIPRRIVEG